MGKKYFINPLAVIFHPVLDKENNYETIVFNPQTGDTFKINRFGYSVLKTIEDNPGLSLDYWQDETRLAKFVDQMARENVVSER